MKTYLRTCFVIVVLLLTACTKEKQPSRVNPKKLEGIWELRVSSGGMVAFSPGLFAQGNGDQWRFTGSEYARYFKDTLYQTGKYTISIGTGTDPNTQRSIDQFIFDQVPSESFELRDDTLRFYYGPIAADGIIQMYVKISDQL